jgi:uncharacterized protein YkwD
MLVLLCLASALLLAPAAAQAANCTPDASWGTLDKAFEAQVAVQLNQQREANKLPDLQVSPLLTNSSEWKSLHMAFYDEFDHTDDYPPVVGRTADVRLSDCGYTFNTDIGENIAEGFQTPSDVVAAWMNSPEHRANILNPTFTVLGVGAARDASGAYWWTTDFGGYADPGTVPAGATPVTTAPTTAAPPVAAPPVTTTAPPATTATTPPVTTAPKTTAPPTTTVGATIAAAAAAESQGTTRGIGKAVHANRLVAKKDRVHVWPGRLRILHPLANDLDPENTPLHLVKVLGQPRGSLARVRRDGQSILLRLAPDAHGLLKLVYLVSTASGREARGIIKISIRK